MLRRSGPPIRWPSELSEIGAVIKTLFASWPVLNMVLGMTLVSFAGYGGGQFAPPYFIRAFGLSYGEVGLIVGLVAGISQGIGTLAGGPITDRLGRLGPKWYSLVPAIGVTLAFPFIYMIYMAASWQAAALLLLLPGLFSYVYLGPTFGVVQNMVPAHRRATATAVLLFFVNLIALGGGPPFAGWVIDHFAAFHLANPSQTGLWAAVSHLFSVDAATFQTACPGGAAPAGAAADAADACKGSLVLATRHGIIAAYAVSLWGALHYFLGAFGLAKAMARARADRGEA